MMLSVYETVRALDDFWKKNGKCSILQPYTSEIGAATLHPYTVLHTLIKSNWNIAYFQPSIRPFDGRYGKSSMRLYQHHQYQVILKPSPDNFCSLYRESLKSLGLKDQEIRFIPDNWRNPSVGASGVGWEVWCNAQEISQITYMQQIGGIECSDGIPGEIAYGLERLCMAIQGVDKVGDLVWDTGIKYSELFEKNEYNMSKFALENSPVELLMKAMEEILALSSTLIMQNLPFAAYDNCLKASHILNLIDARGAISATQRADYILNIRKLVQGCCKKLINENNISK